MTHPQPEALRLERISHILTNGETVPTDRAIEAMDSAAAELRRLHAELDEQCRLLGMGGTREARLMAERDEARRECEALRAERDKSERRAIMFGDILNNHILAMRAAVVDGHLQSPAHGLQWIVNTLEGPGHLPDLDEARALGGAQALFDKETAEHEAFRAAHPAPAALSRTKEQA